MSLHSNAHLLVINNAAEQDAVANWWKNTPGNNVFGLYCKLKSKTHVSM